jgi:hypothetical protein
MHVLVFDCSRYQHLIARSMVIAVNKGRDPKYLCGVRLKAILVFLVVTSSYVLVLLGGPPLFLSTCLSLMRLTLLPFIDQGGGDYRWMASPRRERDVGVKGTIYLSAFRDRGVPKPTSECAACPSPDGSSAWASAKGGKE